MTKTDLTAVFVALDIFCDNDDLESIKKYVKRVLRDLGAEKSKEKDERK